MAVDASILLSQLAQVDRERQVRDTDPALAQTVATVKAYQQRRFARTHAGLLADPRYADAARFFLEDLYGPQDFRDRDAQFARIVPALVRLFPEEVVATVGELTALHALSEQLDTAVARQLTARSVSRASYAEAWQRVGRRPDRLRQVDMVLALGQRLEHYTQKRLLRQTLRLMRAPAHAAGLAALQAFLERGFDTFAAMHGAGQFLDSIRRDELALMTRLFEPGAIAAAQGRLADGDPLNQLP